jgi:hypothetical protein
MLTAHGWQMPWLPFLQNLGKGHVRTEDRAASHDLLLKFTVSMTFEIKELAIHDSILTGCSGFLFGAIAEENVRN